MKIERLLAIVVLLLNRRRVTALQLAEQFEVSLRTIYRDIQTLNGAGIPVISSQGYEGGFSIPENYKLSRQLLTFDDMMSLLTTLQGVNRTLQNSDVERVIEKIASLVPEDKDELYRLRSHSLLIDVAPWGMGPRLGQLIRLMSGAVADCRQLSFRYTDGDGKGSERQVEPHTLIFKGYTWYVLAWCRLRGDFRFFRLSRIRDLVVCDERFARRPVDPQQLTLSSTKPLVELVLRFRPQMRVRVEECFEPEHLRYQEDGTIIATASMPEDDWLLSFILSFGTDGEVLAPGRLRRAVAGKVAAMAELYGSGAG